MIWTDSNEGGCLGPDRRYPALLCAYLGQQCSSDFLRHSLRYQWEVVQTILR